MMVGFSFMVVGVGFICWAQFWTPKNSKFTISSIFMMLGGTFLACSNDSDVGFITMGILLLLPSTPLSIWYIIQRRKRITEERSNFLLNIGATNLDRFFVECVLSSCNDFSIKNVEKAKILANKYELSYPDGILALYEQGLNAHKEISQKIVNDKLADLRIIEQKEYKELNKYALLYGKMKTISMLNDKMNELLNRAESANQYSDMLVRSAQQREYNWGIWGGIADGIAGPGAGIATAISIQETNAKIRTQNEATMKTIIPQYMFITNNASQNRKNALEIEKQIQIVKEKLIDEEILEEDIFKNLSITNTSIEVSETGAFKISAVVEVKNPFFIFDDVPAVADGTICAHVFEDGIEIGSANLVFPVNGIYQKNCIQGIGLSGAHKDKKQTIVFSPEDMWLIER